jgi:hypothetical protein
MKCSKQSFTGMFLSMAVLLSLSTFAVARTAKRQCMEACRAHYRDLPSPEPSAIVRVSGNLPGLHPIQLYWFRTRMTELTLRRVLSNIVIYVGRS